MTSKNIIFLSTVILFTFRGAEAQTLKIQQGLLFKTGTNIRLGSIWISNKRTLAIVKSNTVGVFNITALASDTLEFSGDHYQARNFVVTDFADKIVYMDPVIELQEVVIKENSVKKDIKDV